MEHWITVDKDSELYRVLGKEKVVVNSVHHQAIKDLAKTLKVTATAPDGIIEAFEGTEGSWLLGVQFHPERMSHREEFHGLLGHFVRVAGRGK